MPLDFSPLEQAVSQLARGLQRAASLPDDELLRDGVIQRFEYTYELSHKMLKRYLELTDPSPEVISDMTFQNLIRTGSERGLLKNSWDVWSSYRKARSISSHTYDEEKAKEIFEQIPPFLEEAQALLAELQRRPNL